MLIGSRHVLKFAIVFSITSTAQLASDVEAAQWSVHGPPVQQAVPQYRPAGSAARYPLNNQPGQLAADSSASTAQKLPSVLQSDSAKSPAPLPAAPFASQPASRLPTLPNQPVSQQNESAGKSVFPANSADPQTAASKKSSKQKQEKGPRYVVDYSAYRDRNRLPIDPRKPCNSCTHPPRSGHCANCDAPGLHGRPYQEREPGGCRCDDKHSGKKRPMFSAYWARPFSAKLDDHFPAMAAERYQACQLNKIVDVFDHLEDFKLIDYKRKDNGYCGPGSDPYGCLGENRQLSLQPSRVAGVGYRFPSEPAAPAGANGFRY